jgi:hypothetical protein
MTAIPPTTEPAAPSAAAERMRRHRQRCRDGLRCLMIELRERQGIVMITIRFNRRSMHSLIALWGN